MGDNVEKIGEKTEHNFEIPPKWFDLSLIRHPIFNQVFFYQGIAFSVNSFKDSMFTKIDNDLKLFSLSAFLLKLDPTLSLNQKIGYVEEVAIQSWGKFSRLLRSGRISTHFLVDENNLHCILEINQKRMTRFSFIIDVSDNFYIETNERDRFKNIIHGTVDATCFPLKEPNNLNLISITTLLNQFKNF